MELTSFEKTYYDEFAKSFGKYGNDIPTPEWERLSKIRQGLDITLTRSKEILAALQGISSIVTKSPLDDFEKFVELYNDTSQPLLDF